MKRLHLRPELRLRFLQEGADLGREERSLNAPLADQTDCPSTCGSASIRKSGIGKTSTGGSGKNR
jgi:hypothetical protein